MSIDDMSNLIVMSGGRTLELLIYYKLTPTSGVLIDTLLAVQTNPATATVKTLGDSLAAWYKPLLEQRAAPQLMKMVVRWAAVATTPAVGNQIIAQYDLKRAKMAYYIKSSLKIQNRTTNTATSTEADDVDNVPLYGKAYDGPGNYFSLGENYFSPAHNTQQNFFIRGNLSTEPMAEPLPVGQFKRLKTCGKAHLDPGQIKTSVLTDSGKMGFNMLTLKLGASEAATNILAIGKQRVYILEKMIQSVATGDATGIKLAYEVDFKSGFSVYLPNLVVTTQLLTINPV
jgi:hypothetical protein